MQSHVHDQPPDGAWLRPVGRMYGYCLRAVRSWPATDDDGPCTEFERWGLDRQAMRPVRDREAGHCWISCLRQVLPGVWRDTCDFGGNPRWECCPLYYRLMTIGPAGQMEMFQ